jgi:hypothetical protein
MKISSAGKFLRGHLRSRAGIEPIAPRIAQQVEREDPSHHGQRGEHDHVRRVKKMAARVVEHGAPTGDGREDVEAEEAQRGFGKNGSRNVDGSLHKDRLENVRQQVAKQRIKRPPGTRGKPSGRSWLS